MLRSLSNEVSYGDSPERINGSILYNNFEMAPFFIRAAKNAEDADYQWDTTFVHLYIIIIIVVEK